MTLAIVCVGKLRERCWREAVAEYQKRLARLGGLSIVECTDLPEPKNASPADLQRIVEAEGASILGHLRPRDFVFALCVDGKQYTSPGLAERLRALEDHGVGRAAFVIGGSNGLSAAVLAKAGERISFSPMTFPHQLARVMLAEQLYRSRKILAGEAYHK